MQPSEFHATLTRAHYVKTLEGTNNTLFYLASSAPIEDKRLRLPPTVVSALGLPAEIRTMFDYRSRYAGIYNRLYQFCVISLCADIEGFFKALFLERGFKKGSGRGFFQRFDQVVATLEVVGFDFSPLRNELEKLRRAFQIRHICIHNLGHVDSDFASTTRLPVKLGDMYVVDESEFKSIFDAYVEFLRNIDAELTP